MACSGLVSQQLGKDVCSGDVYIFLGKDLTKIKLLVWQTGGFMLYYKRLEAGTFRLPPSVGKGISLSYSELCLLIEGLEVVVTHRRKRFVAAEKRPASP